MGEQMTSSPMDRWKDYDRTVFALGHDADRRRRVAENAEAYADDLRSGRAWEQFCEALTSLGPQLISSGLAGDDVSLAEGYRYLLGLVTLRLHSALYGSGPDAPAFVRGLDDVVKVGLDNPDGINSYLAEVADDRTYRIFGVAGQERYVEFVQTGPSGTLANNYLDEFEIEADGSFEIWLSPNDHEGNHIWSSPGVSALLVRQVQYDWENETLSEIRIEQPASDAVPECLTVPHPADVGEQLPALGRTMKDEVDFWLDYTRSFSASGDNMIDGGQPLAFSGVSAVRAAPKGSFNIAEHEALILELEPPEGLFWSVAIGDVWFRSIDPSHRQTSLNGHQVRLDPDGRCRIVIAHRDPRIANWLDTAHHQRGIITFRYVRTVSRPAVTCTVVPFEDLGTALPPDTARVSPQERARIISGRKLGFSRRYAQPFTSRWSSR
jgi:hypothetical protein